MEARTQKYAVILHSEFRIPNFPVTLLPAMRQKTVFILSIALFLGLLLWGIFSTLVYLGVPVHGAVYLPNDVLESLQGVCDPGGLFCRGVYTLIPMILRTLGRTGPFIPYVILWLLIGAAIVGRSAIKTGMIRFRTTLSPLWVIGFFFVSVWTLFTVFSYGSIGDAPLRRVVEPLPEVYLNVKGEGLEELTKNFNRLEDQGCLRQVGAFQNGAKVFNMTTFCMQKFFVTRVFTQFVWALFILFELITLGHMALRRFRLSMHPFTEAVLSASLGAGLWIVLLWLLAVFHIFVSAAIWILLLAVPALSYKSVLHWWKMLRAKIPVDLPPWSPTILIGWLLLSYLALNFLTVIRPFPIGWDDLGSYLNRPNLLVSYGHFIYSMAAFQWEYLTAVGFSLFGFGSPVGATAAMIINWLEGVLAVAAVWAFGRSYFGPRGGLLSALLYYSLPLVGHFSYADMKIDNAVFTMGALSTLCVFLGILQPRASEEETSARPFKEQLLWIALAGVFVGFAFGMKVTAIMVVVALLIIMGGVALHWTAAVGAASFAVVVLATEGGLSLMSVGQRLFGDGTELATKGILLFFILLGVAFSGVGLFLGRRHWKKAALLGGVFIASFLAVLAPWVLHNNFERGYIIPRAFEFGAPNKISLTLDLYGTGSASNYDSPVRVMPPELRMDPNSPFCAVTGGREELDRYWGFRVGWEHYLTLPWRTVLNLDSAGYYVTTMSALLLFPLLLLLPYFWTKRGKWLRWMTIGTLVILLEWMFMGNGIPWYGIGVFLGLVLGLEAFIARAPDAFSRSLAGGLIAVALFSNFAHRFWQFEQQRNLFEYPLGRASAEVMRERTIPHYDDIAEIAVELSRTEPERPYMYRVGTFIPYFIPRNLEVIGIADHQLDIFNCLYQERDSELTTKRLKALGFSSIIFDTNTATIERDSNGSLHKKVQALVDYLNDPKSGLQVIINDQDGGVAYLLIP
ncbi:hypothetical protein A2881_01830 [Candidatus Peribacteria bacterium RIFCSPHIGHO2_01_FULL_55_13]|nr:MAG: hypothetical protein A2881_01830 [Candidatus Peribacteria bacterium RIFCSPHIGHO2_01_FULL_55_13]OGJ65704.1 MAG: hypothetical protein A3F36_03360 [Candidatus Peribacteria bacterium RIFCSPHIGHO2_12_FULL_55_11]